MSSRLCNSYKCKVSVALRLVTEDLSALLRKHEHLFDNQAAYAKALGIDVGRLNRLLNRKGQYALNVLNCLRFAKLTGERPSVILRAAGKGDVAALVEELYGSERELTASQSELLRLWAKVPTQAQGPLLFVMRAYDRPDDDLPARTDATPGQSRLRRRTPDRRGRATATDRHGKDESTADDRAR